MNVGIRMIASTAALLAAACATAPTEPGPSTEAAAESHPIDQVAWLAGRWVGEGLQGALEETWAQPAGGQMVGHFQLVVDGAVSFYEIMLLDVVDGGVRMRVKHFEANFVGWEEADRWIEFEPVSVTEDEIAFDGLVIRRTGSDSLEMSLMLQYDDGVREEILRMTRAPL